MGDNSEADEVHVENKPQVRSAMKRVINLEEAPTFEDRGLGRGVDATNPTPWLNKRAIQVRKVHFEDIIGTEEGNLYQGFVNEVESTQHFQTSLSASVPANQLVSLGIDSELSRSYSVTQKSVGRKIITRTISFRANFDRSIQKREDEKCFEERLNNWIVEQKKVKDEEREIKKVIEKSNRPNDATKTEQNDQNGSVKIGEMTLTFDECFELCYDFISSLAVTHYVHALELGASHYRVMSLEEYATKFSSKAKLGVGNMADIAIGNEKSFNARRYKNQTTKVGRMNIMPDDKEPRPKLTAKKNESDKEETESSNATETAPTVEEEVLRNTIGEAVVGIKLQPLSSLVQNVKLRVQLQQALQKYIHDKQQVKFGPFYIACDEDKLYLTVNTDKDYEVETTYDINKATQLYIVRCEEGDNHFHIVYERPMSHGRSLKKFIAKVGDPQHRPAIPRYLSAHINWKGRNKRNKPLKMSLDGQSHNSKLAIYSRHNGANHPADLTEWVNEKEIFFIKCQEPSVRKPISSYLCVYASGRTGCKPTVQSSDGKNKFMLFRLLTPAKDAHSTTADRDQLQDMDEHGPFLIKNSNSVAQPTGLEASTTASRFLKVGKGSKTRSDRPIDITTDLNEASHFYVKRVDELSNYFEVIFNDGDNKLYLSAKKSPKDDGYRSLQVQSDISGAWANLAIHGEKMKPATTDDRKKWLNGDERFYISCYVKPVLPSKQDISYLVIRETKFPNSRSRYSISCVLSGKIDHKASREFMQFELVTPPPEAEENEPQGPRQAAVQKTQGTTAEVTADVNIETD